MSIYVRELLCELANESLDVDSRVDLIAGLEHLYKTGQIGYGDLYVLNKYIEGYAPAEIANHMSVGCVVTAQYISESLVSTLALLEESCQYTDELIIQQGLRIYPKYKKTVDAFRNKCMELSNNV